MKGSTELLRQFRKQTFTKCWRLNVCPEFANIQPWQPCPLLGRFCAVFFKLSIPLCETCFKQILETWDDRSLCSIKFCSLTDHQRIEYKVYKFCNVKMCMFWETYIFTKHLASGLRLLPSLVCIPCWPPGWAGCWLWGLKEHLASPPHMIYGS